VAALRTRRMASPAETVGMGIPTGTEGIVQAPLTPLGTVYLAGEPWSARAVADTWLPRDTPVRLVGFDGLVALVQPVLDHAPTTPAAPVATDRPQ